MIEQTCENCGYTSDSEDDFFHPVNQWGEQFVLCQKCDLDEDGNPCRDPRFV